MAANLKDVIANLRAIIISFKGALPIVNIQKDYEEAFGEKVPLKSLGFSNLQELFEKNPADFQLVGDKVTIIEKKKSSHISSLVQRQGRGKTKNAKNFRRHQRPRNLNVDVGFEGNSINNKNETSWNRRQANGKKSDRNGFKPHVKSDSIEKITLRKPRENSNNYITPSSLVENNTNFKYVTKTVVNERYSGQPNYIYNGEKGLEPFKDVEDLPIGKGAQSRLLKKKYKMLEELKSSEENRDSNPESEPLAIYFDLHSIDSLSVDVITSDGLPSPSGSSSSSGSQFPTAMQHELPNSRQKAQARIANIKSSMQANLMQYEINNKLKNNSAFALSSPVETNVPKINASKLQQDPRLSSASLVMTSNVTPKTEKAECAVKNSRSNNNAFEMHDAVQSDLNESSAKYMKILEEMCKSRGFLKPTYKIIVREPKNEPKHYICKVSIENYLQMSSYPLETRDVRSAKCRAAKKMIDYLNLDPNFVINVNVNSKEEVIIPRILEIVEPTCGVWSDKLPILYKENYKDNLRKDWLDVIMKTNIFDIENFDGTRFIIRKKTDIKYDGLGSTDKIEKGQVAQPETPTIRELTFPDTKYWEVYITNVSNSDEIWCRLIGENHSDAYDNLMTKLELEPPERKAPNPRLGGIYGIKVSAIWYRVKLTELLDESRGMVFYIDDGDKEIVDLTELFEPQEVFFTVAPQAIMLSLHGLEFFSDDEELKSFITGNLLGNTYIAEVLSLSQEMKNFIHERKSVRLWDTSTDLDINVNKLLINNIIKNITLPVLPSINQIKEVLVSSINDLGEVHIQTNMKSIHHLKCLVLNKIKSTEGNPVRRNLSDTIGTDIIHLTKCRKNDVYSRVKVIEIQNSATVNVLFIDYGFVERIAISDLIHLEKTSILQAIPAQAVKVKMSNITNFSADVISKLKEYLLNQNLLMKVLETNRGNAPIVEFFKRSPGGNTLYSVNQKIINIPDLKNSDFPSRRKSIVVGLEKVMPKNLPSPNLPDMGQHFDVFVTFASSPDLFIVQPVSSRMLLMEMMNELQTICNGSDVLPILPEEFVIGEIYAVKHPDGYWYRGCAQAVLGSCNYSIYMCDFGDCIMVTHEKLQHLPTKFQTIPYQAVRATLCGIDPEDRDWTPVDCITFHKLVVERYFVAIAKEIQRDDKNPNYVNLGLILIDTSGEEDLYIHKVLLEKKNEAFTFIKSLSIS